MTQEVNTNLKDKLIYISFVQGVRNQINGKAILLNSFLDYWNLSKARSKICSFLSNEYENMGTLYIINVI